MEAAAWARGHSLRSKICLLKVLTAALYFCGTCKKLNKQKLAFVLLEETELCHFPLIKFISRSSSTFFRSHWLEGGAGLAAWVNASSPLWLFQYLNAGGDEFFLSTEGNQHSADASHISGNIPDKGDSLVVVFCATTSKNVVYHTTTL